MWVLPQGPWPRSGHVVVKAAGNAAITGTSLKLELSCWAESLELDTGNGARPKDAATRRNSGSPRPTVAATTRYIQRPRGERPTVAATEKRVVLRRRSLPLLLILSHMLSQSSLL